MLKDTIVNKCLKDQYIIRKFAEIRKINYVCSVNKKGGKYENLKFLPQQRKKRITFNFVQQQKKKNIMLITRTKVRGFKPITIKGIPTKIAIRHYLIYRKMTGRDIKLIVTKRTF